MNQLPSWIKPNTADAYNHAYTFLYCKQPRDIREMLDKAKDTDFNTRETREFMKEVRRIAEYEPSHEDLKALERKEKVEGIHPSQHKKPELPKVDAPEVEQPKETPKETPKTEDKSRQDETGNAS